MVIHLENYMFDLLLEGYRLEGNYNTNARARNTLLYTSGSGLKDITIRNSHFLEGSYGMYLNCTTNYNLRMKIDSNRFDSLGICCRSRYGTFHGRELYHRKWRELF